MPFHERHTICEAPRWKNYERKPKANEVSVPPPETFDHIIVGTGQATGTLLSGLLKTGESIAVIEGGDVGGSCVNVGCTPTKTLVASAKVAHQARRAGYYGIETGPVSIDFAKVRERMNRIRHGNRDGLKRWITSNEQVTFFPEFAHFIGPKRLQVGDVVIEGGNIYLNVGTRPRIPQIPGIDTVPWLDNSRLLELEDVPGHLIIMGGGYIGLEFAQVFRRFGAKVTLLQRSRQLVPREDADVADAIQAILEHEDISLHLSTAVTEVAPLSNTGIRVTYKQSDQVHTVDGSHFLVAIGRVSNADRLQVEAAGLETGKRNYICVDDYCRTNVEGVFALGDVNGKGGFTHTAVNDAEIVLDYLHGGTRKISDRLPTYALFIDPPLGRVGMTEKEAVAAGYKVLKATRLMATINRAKEMGETQGFVKLLVDAETDLILGGSILGAGGDEIINMFTAFMYSKLPCHTYRKIVLVHPTISELMPWILDTLAPIDAADHV